MEGNSRWLAAVVFILLAGSFATTATAQTVNAEALTRDEEGFGFELAGALSIQRGNTYLTNVGGGLHAQYQTHHDQTEQERADEVPPWIAHRVFVNGAGSFAADEEDAIVKRSSAHARWTAMWWKRLGSEVFAQYQYDEFRRLQARVLAGVGARAVLVHTAEFQAALGSGYMAEYENLTPEAAGDDPPETIAHRWTNFLSARLALFEDDRLVLQNTVYVQPRFDDFSDFRVLEEFELDVAVTKVLSFGTALTVAHDSRPPTDVEPTDLRLEQRIKVSF